MGDHTWLGLRINPRNGPNVSPVGADRRETALRQLTASYIPPSPRLLFIAMQSSVL